MNRNKKYFLVLLAYSFFAQANILFQEDDFERMILMKEATSKKNESDKTILYLRPNTTQLFTELYRSYGLLNNPHVNVVEKALYLDQIGAPTSFPLQPSNMAVFNHAEKLLKEFHTRSGNLELFLDPADTKSFFFTGNGSAQIIYALVYTLATTFPDQNFLVVEKSPYYSGHQAAVTLLFKYPNVRWQGFNEPSDIDLKPGETLVEFVTSPNNPDGVFRKPLTDASIIIADFVFSSSAYGDGTGFLDANLEWVRLARAEGKHVFSFNSASKQFGKTGCRCGYIWYPMNDAFAESIFPNFFNYISLSTIGSGSVGLTEFLNLISAFLATADTGSNLRRDAHASIIKRHTIIQNEILSRYPGSIVVSVPGSPALFVNLADARIPAESARDVIFEDLRASVSGGISFGATDAFFRVNITGFSAELAEFANRLAGFEKYQPQDFFMSSENICSKTNVYGNRREKTSYVANPNDCLIKAQAKEGAIDIILPEFIDYNVITITIKKTDSSHNPVTIRSANFTKVLSSACSEITVTWSQPNFIDGAWTIK